MSMLQFNKFTIQKAFQYRLRSFLTKAQNRVLRLNERKNTWRVKISENPQRDRHSKTHFIVRIES